ncbi:hypothetical protein ACFYE2_03085 [Kocuria sp. CPCC 205300]|uniref:hypothetical protein n=1 Tax=Kocuria sabuli TaxID=3071448 RepID=UPI0036D90264
MSKKTALFALVLASGLALTGCSDDAEAPGDGAGPSRTPAASSSGSPSSGAPSSSPPASQTPEEAASPSSEPEPTEAAPANNPPEPAEPAPAEPAPADPLAAFTGTAAGAQFAGALTGVEIMGGTGAGPTVHRISTNLYDPGVAVALCESYRAAMGTGRQQVDVVDALGQYLATNSADPAACATAPGANPGPGAIPAQDFDYDEAYAAWQSGMPYYDAFCLNYTPVTAAGASQCEGIEAGTVDAITGEYIGG